MKKEISWQAPTHIFIPKTIDWYWIVGIISSTIIVISIILGNIIFAILILVSTIVVFLNAHREPELVQIILNQKGIKIGNKVHFYEEIGSFWVEDGNMYPRILLKSDRLLSPFIIVMIHEEDGDEIRDFLKEHLHEEHLNENLLEKILIYFGF